MLKMLNLECFCREIFGESVTVDCIRKVYLYQLFMKQAHLG